ncbi:hypothetical protein FOZ62_032199 [Perkinsus olseni]|uniref:DUF4460 domain-containing protein n=2 Tax=Perkinsus olseni TaxID=32597 RepID=A0A7J6UFP4_PEROL|nr:hypothetical protein FOZ62_032199 [Perkinsus olseni]
MAASGTLLRSTMKRLLRPFYLTVHPDITSTNMPSEAASVNAKALQEVNAYVEALASTPSHPVVARTVTFFKPRGKEAAARSVAKNGRRLRPVMQCSFELSSIPPGADFSTREGLAARLVRDIEAALVAEAPSMFSSKPHKGTQVESLMKSGSIPTSKTGDPWKKLWDDETQERMFKMSLYDAETEEERRSRVYKEELFNRSLYRVARKAVKTKNEKRKMERLMDAERVAMEMVDEKLRKQAPQEAGYQAAQNSDDEDPETPTEFIQRKARVVEGGYHPDLVFYSPQLDDQAKRREGISRICGLGLEDDGDMWLLENVWRAVRAPPTPLPLVIGTKFEALHDKGYFEIPYNFELKDLVGFLEEHMDALKESRAKLIEELYVV